MSGWRRVVLKHPGMVLIILNIFLITVFACLAFSSLPSEFLTIGGIVITASVSASIFSYSLLSQRKFLREQRKDLFEATGLSISELTTLSRKTDVAIAHAGRTVAALEEKVVPAILSIDNGIKVMSKDMKVICNLLYQETIARAERNRPKMIMWTDMYKLILFSVYLVKVKNVGPHVTDVSFEGTIGFPGQSSIRHSISGGLDNFNRNKIETVDWKVKFLLPGQPVVAGTVSCYSLDGDRFDAEMHLDTRTTSLKFYKPNHGVH